MLDVLAFFFASMIGTAVAVIVLGGIALFSGLLPKSASIVLVEVMTEVMDTVIPNRAMIFSFDPIHWYGRGNVLYQNGMIQDRPELDGQRSRADFSFRYLHRLARA